MVSGGFCITYLSQIHENMVCWSYLLSARMRLYAEQDKTQCTRYQLSILTLRNRLWKIRAKPLLWEIWFDFRLTNLICLHRKVCINLLKGGTSFFWSSWSLYERSCRISFTIQFFFVWGAFFFYTSHAFFSTATARKMKHAASFCSSCEQIHNSVAYQDLHKHLTWRAVQ